MILTKAHMVVQKVPTAHPSTLKDPNTRDYVNAHGNSRKNLFAAVKASLERMQIEYIDLFQLHRYDYATPIEETMDALHDVRSPGSHNRDPELTLSYPTARQAGFDSLHRNVELLRVSCAPSSLCSASPS